MIRLLKCKKRRSSLIICMQFSIFKHFINRTRYYVCPIWQSQSKVALDMMILKRNGIKTSVGKKHNRKVCTVGHELSCVRIFLCTCTEREKYFHIGDFESTNQFSPEWLERKNGLKYLNRKPQQWVNVLDRCDSVYPKMLKKFPLKTGHVIRKTSESWLYRGNTGAMLILQHEVTAQTYYAQ